MKSSTRHPDAQIEIIKGNLLSREDCERAVGDVRVIYHLAAGIEKSFAGSFMNSVLTTRNLLDAVLQRGTTKEVRQRQFLRGLFNQKTETRSPVGRVLRNRSILPRPRRCLCLFGKSSKMNLFSNTARKNSLGLCDCASGCSLRTRQVFHYRKSWN